MLPQHLVYKNELNREYVITLARNDETPWWWSEKIETCRSGFKCFKWKLYRCICWLIVEVILQNARCNDEIHTSFFFGTNTPHCTLFPNTYNAWDLRFLRLSLSRLLSSGMIMYPQTRCTHSKISFEFFSSVAEDLGLLCHCASSPWCFGSTMILCNVRNYTQ